MQDDRVTQKQRSSFNEGETEKTPLIAKKEKSQPSLQLEYEEVTPYVSSVFGLLCFVALCLVTGGIFLLVCGWFRKFLTTVMKRRAQGWEDAQFALIKGVDKGYEEVPVLNIVHNERAIKMFIYRNQRFIFNPETQTFSREQFQLTQSFQQILEHSLEGIDSNLHEERFLLFGPNLIDIHIKSIPQLLISEVIHPFYIFQIASCVFWYTSSYFYYATLILIMAICSVSWSIHTTRRDMIGLKEIARHEFEVNVHRRLPDGSTQEFRILSSQLVPGDLIEITPQMPVPCDLLLLTGECVMNESMLTGESNPVLKYPISPTGEIYSESIHKRFTLFCGTNVIQCKKTRSEKVLGVVIRTGFGTVKGALFLSILFPKPLHFKFYTDSYKFLAIMIVFALAGFAKTLADDIPSGYDPVSTLKDALDLITIAVPPALPIVLTVGIGFALERLKAKQIFCTSPPRINFAGKVNLFCFDKTGTLTEDSLSMEGVVFWDKNKGPNEAVFEKHHSRIPAPFLAAMATAHSIGVVSGEMVGHPVDVQMFQTTQWTLNEPQPDDGPKFLAMVTNPEKTTTFGVLRRFEFLPALQRMSSISMEMSDRSIILCTKGSPEVIRDISAPESIPPNLDEVMSQYTQQGLYVLACGFRVLDPEVYNQVETVTRESVERDLQFCGLLVLENKLKGETTAVINKLLAAHIGCVMITGDNILTGISVARKCHIIPPSNKVLFSDLQGNGEIVWRSVDNPNETFSDPIPFSRTFSDKMEDQSFGILESNTDGECELAMTGKALDIITNANNQSQYDELLKRTRIFARVSPDQKSQIVESFIDYGYFVGMTGDGTNDCGALRASHVGLSLSEAEASVVAPFTDRNKTVAGVLKLIREGRGALVNSFVAFKYMILYPVIQYVAALRLYHIGSKLGDFQYLYQDVFVVLPISIAMLLTGASRRLHFRTPTSNLFAPTILVSLFVEVATEVGFIILINRMLAIEDWFTPFVEKDELVVKCPENTVTFLYSNFQYTISALAFSKGCNFRKAFYTNWWYNGCLLLAIGTSIGLVFLPASSFTDFLELVPPPDSFKWKIICIAGLNAVFSFVMQFVVIEGPVADFVRNYQRERIRQKKMLQSQLTV